MKIIIILKGGLGNQLFQYAHARSLAIDHKVKLVLDKYYGFRKNIYNRVYELNNFPIYPEFTNLIDQIPYFLYLIKKKTHKFIKINYEEKFLNIQIISENELKYLPYIKKIKIENSTWLDGYWQSYKYFEHHTKILQKELMPNKPLLNHYLKIAEEMKSKESVAVGFRMYEETNNPKFYAKNGVIKALFEYKSAIKKIQNQYPNCKIYFFCTKQSKLLNQLELPKNTLWITPNNGYIGSSNRLWLLSNCKHHVFNNSSFYWWGAWLSEARYKNFKQIIFATDNFINKNAIPKNWNKF